MNDTTKLQDRGLGRTVLSQSKEGKYWDAPLQDQEEGETKVSASPAIVEAQHGQPLGLLRLDQMHLAPGSDNSKILDRSIRPAHRQGA